MSKVVRSVKNVTKGYSSVQVKVRNATSNDPWGPSGTEMSEIAQMTFNSSTDFYEIMDMLDKRLNDKGKNWRHVLKSLRVLDYCLHEGSELVVTWARKNIYIIKTLREFQYIDEDGRDVGQNVRMSAKELTNLILDEDRLRTERADKKSWKSRVTGIEDGLPGFGGGSDPSSIRDRPARQPRRRQNDEDDLEYKLAIEASKNEAEEDARRRARSIGVQPDDDDLEKAIKLSREEEDLRRRQLEETNAQSLFDDAPVQPAQAQPTGWNQGYQQGPSVDFWGSAMDQQQPQATGYLNDAYSQSTGLQNQQTGFQNGYGYSNPYQQAQPTGFDQAQYQQQQPAYLQSQQTSFTFNNPYSQPSSGFGIGQQQQQQQPIEQQNTLQAGSNNPWSSQQQAHDTMKPLPTGSNNPFASAVNRPQTFQQSRVPTLSTLQEQQAQTQFTTQAYNQPTSFSPQPTSQQKDSNPHHAQLNALLATGEGQDTFGNVGNLRIPAQHTAPGTFVNSAGQGLDRLYTTQTGSNPFFKTQFTGVPQQTGFTQQTQPGRMMPAQTGPAGAFGGSGFGGGSNPFGRQQGGQQQSGSLIDL